jgi:hypothetical protein
VAVAADGVTPVGIDSTWSPRWTARTFRLTAYGESVTWRAASGRVRQTASEESIGGHAPVREVDEYHLPRSIAAGRADVASPLAAPRPYLARQTSMTAAHSLGDAPWMTTSSAPASMY